MTAHEVFLTPDQLAPLLERLMQHCLANDAPAIRALLSEAPTGYATRQSLPALRSGLKCGVSNGRDDA